MEQKPYASFQHIIHRNKFPNDEIWVHRWRGESFFLVKGNITRVNTHTNENLSVFEEGMIAYRDDKVIHESNIERCDAPKLRPIVCTAVGDAEVFCLDPKMNKKDSVVIAFKMIGGEKKEFKIGTKMFLCRGSLLVNGTPVTGPTQVSFSTSDMVGECTTEVLYGWIFP